MTSSHANGGVASTTARKRRATRLSKCRPDGGRGLLVGDYLVPAVEGATNGEFRTDRAVGAVRDSYECAPVVCEVHVAARRDVLIGLHASSVGELKLAHPHEPGSEFVTEESDERLPLGALVLAELSSYRLAGHASSVDHADSQNKARLSLGRNNRETPTERSSGRLRSGWQSQ